MQDLGLQHSRSEAAESLQTLIRAARSGDDEARNNLIRNYQPFIYKTAATISRRYLRPGLDDELSIALMAFNEAIDCYDMGGRVPFLSFAQIVIRRRLVDFFREQTRNNRELPLGHFEAEGDGEREAPLLPGLVRAAEAAHTNWQDSMERREEILAFGRILAEYGLDYRSLAKVTPKHADTRLRLVQIGRSVAHDAKLMAKIHKRRMLPVPDLVNLSGLSRKTIERHRKFLLAIVLILANDFPYLQIYFRS